MLPAIDELQPTADVFADKLCWFRRAVLMNVRAATMTKKLTVSKADAALIDQDRAAGRRSRRKR
jgi:hypothetical protein